MRRPLRQAEPSLFEALSEKQGVAVESACAASAIPSGWSGLDAWLGGGWPLGSISELRGPGRSSLALGALREAARARLPIAWVDGSGGFDPASARELLGEVDLVRPRAGETARRGASRRALQAAELLLRSRAHALLVLDMPPGSAPAAAFFRLDRLARRAQAALLLLQNHQRSLAGSAAPRLYEVSLRPQPGVRLDPAVQAPGLNVRVLRHRGKRSEGEFALRPQLRTAVESRRGGALPS